MGEHEKSRGQRNGKENKEAERPPDYRSRYPPR
jgi:hypothetical protein